MIRAGERYRIDYGFPLVSLFANDERTLEKVFVLNIPLRTEKTDFVYTKRRLQKKPEPLILFCDLLPAASAMKGKSKTSLDLCLLDIPIRSPFTMEFPDLAYPLRKEFDKTK